MSHDPGHHRRDGQHWTEPGGCGKPHHHCGGALPNNGPEDLKRWILDPPGQKPGTQMPNLHLSDEEATRIVAYLETLK